MTARSPTRIDADRVIRDIAARQHGVVTRVQLLHEGVGPDRVDRRLRAGRLGRMHAGVYLAGPVATPSTRAMAAVLACGRHAAVAVWSAAVRWQLLPADREVDAIEIIAARGRAGRIAGVRIHHVQTLRSYEVTRLDRIPITTPARTLYDLAAVATNRELERALAEAFARRLVSRSKLLKVLEGRVGRPGARRLRELVDGGREPARTRSDLEERLLAMVRRTGLPKPETNVRIAGREVDFLWRAQRLVLEVDGRATHDTARGFERDRRRDALLVANGFRVMRVTSRQLAEEPDTILVRLAQALVQPSGP